MWLHIAVTRSEDAVTLMLASEGFSASVPFSIEMTRSTDSITLNPGRGSFLLDELYIDGVAETAASFRDVSEKRVPWSTLDMADKHFIIAMDPDSNFATNVPFARHLVMDDSDFAEIFPAAQAGGQS